MDSDKAALAQTTEQLAEQFQQTLQINKPEYLSRFIDPDGNLLLDALLAYIESCQRPGVEGTLIKLNTLQADNLGWSKVKLPSKGLLVGSESEFARGIQGSLHREWCNFNVQEFKDKYQELFHSKKSDKSLFEECPGVVLAGGFLVNYLTNSPKGIIKFYDETDNEDQRAINTHHFNNLPDIDLFLIQKEENADQLFQRVERTIGWIKENRGIVDMPYVSKNAVTILDKSGQEWQIILRRYSTMDEILWGFDLACCQLLFDGNHLYTTEPGLLAFKYNITLVDVNAWYYCFEGRLAKYARKRGFFFYFWFIQEPWAIDCPAAGGFLGNKTGKNIRWYGTHGRLIIELPYMTLNDVCPVNLVDSEELTKLNRYNEVLSEAQRLDREIFYLSNQIKAKLRDLRKDSETPKQQGVRSTRRIIQKDLMELQKELDQKNEGKVKIAEELAQIKQGKIQIRLRNTRVALAVFNNRDSSNSEPINTLLKGKIPRRFKQIPSDVSTTSTTSTTTSTTATSNPVAISEPSDYQPGGITYGNKTNLTWINLKAISLALAGKPAYPIAQLNGKLDEGVILVLDSDYIEEYLMNWSTAMKEGTLPRKALFNLRLLLGEEEAKAFINSIVEGKTWSFAKLMDVHRAYLNKIPHLLKFQIKFQTVMGGTVIAGKADPGRGKTLKEWAGDWLRKEYAN